MARTVTLQAGTQSVHMFAVNLLQYTGERFLQPLLQTPEVQGCATITVLDRAVPALVEAFQILDHKGTPDKISVPQYLKLMLTLSSCNAWSVLAALTSSLFPDEPRGFTYSPKKVPFQLLNGSLEIMKLFFTGIKTSQDKIIGIADKAPPIDL